MSQSGRAEPVRTREVLAFLGLAFGISWMGAIVFTLTGVELGSLRGTVLVVVVYVWAPAVATVLVQRCHGESIRAGCGLRRVRLRWVGLAWVTPVGLLALT